MFTRFPRPSVYLIHEVDPAWLNDMEMVDWACPNDLVMPRCAHGHHSRDCLVSPSCTRALDSVDVTTTYLRDLVALSN